MVSPAPTLLLIHGLGATSGVWSELVHALDWDGRVVAPDLPGHGSAPWTGDYTVGSLAAAISGACDNAEPVFVVGHSLGGAVGISLASGFFRPVVTAVVGLGIKVRWSDDDVAGMAKVAARGIRWLESRDEAVDRFRRQAGLDGLIADDHPAIDGAVVSDADDDRARWRVSQDPATFAQRPLDMAGLVAAARCPVVLGAGEHDEMATEADLARFVAAPRIAPGRGHNVHVEDPDWVAGVIGEVVEESVAQGHRRPPVG